MTRVELQQRNSKIIKYKLEGHTFQQTSQWAKQHYNLSSLSAIFNIWRNYVKTQAEPIDKGVYA